jgi:hypothetical protein
MSDSGFWPGLRGRQDECGTLSRLVASAQAGRSQVLVLRGALGEDRYPLLLDMQGDGTSPTVGVPIVRRLVRILLWTAGATRRQNR